MSEDRSGQIGERHVDARGPEVGNQQAPGRRIQDEASGRPPATARSGDVVGDQATLHELTDALRDDRATQAGAMGNLGARQAVGVPDGIEYRDERIERLIRKGHCPTGRVCHAPSILWTVKGQSGRWSGTSALRTAPLFCSDISLVL